MLSERQGREVVSGKFSLGFLAASGKKQTFALQHSNGNYLHHCLLLRKATSVRQVSAHLEYAPRAPIQIREVAIWKSESSTRADSCSSGVKCPGQTGAPRVLDPGILTRVRQLLNGYFGPRVPSLSLASSCRNHVYMQF